MAVFTRGNYDCACSREVCDWSCTTYATIMMSNLVPNTASQSCKNCANIDNEYCFACDNGNQFKPMNNADRIRSLSDEELAEELWAWNQVCCYKWTKDKILDWLKEEAKGDTDEDKA